MATFAEKYTPKYDKAVECLIKDRQTLLTFFDFPADHWDHLRTSNPIESVFATVRHRTVRMKGALSQDTARLMVFKLVMAASRTWRCLKGQNQLPKVVNGIKFKDGIEAVADIKSAAWFTPSPTFPRSSRTIGVQLIGDEGMNTPPAHALTERGIVGSVRGFMVYGDYRNDHPISEIVHAVATGEVDVAAVWGPVAGYFARGE